MKIIETPDYAALSQRAAEIVVAQVREKPSSLLVLPTGNSPLGMFGELVAASNAGVVDFSQVRFVTLDEYAGIGRDDPRRLLSWLRRELLDPIGMTPDAVEAFDPTAEPQAEVARIDATIESLGGIDLAVVGLGPNGHLGFNEPGSPPDGKTAFVDLTPESIQSNATYWGDREVPRQAFTLGLGTLGQASRLVMIVSGASKAEILARTIGGPVSASVPATLLRTHPNSLVVADSAALAFSV